MNYSGIHFSIILFHILLTFYSISSKDLDFYELLGVEKDANVKTIRRAFKKLALRIHPDKNKDDKDAHAKFLRLNRAYETLKDPTLREKYDNFGEEGLKDDGTSGRWHDWNFYNKQFGIYDEDENIVTLTYSDFEQSVKETDDAWFINYYSAYCGHCHDLAPTWREVANELEGVARIGAINCIDEPQLCTHIRVFPTLIFYPLRIVYSQQNEKDKLVDFVLGYLSDKSMHLTPQSFRHQLKSSNNQPWLVDFCWSQSHYDCLDALPLKKLSLMLESITQIAKIDCDMYGEKICFNTSRADQKSKLEGLLFFSSLPDFEQISSKTVYKQLLLSSKRIDSLEPLEITKSVLQCLPDITLMTGKMFRETLDDIQNKKSSMPWLLYLTNDDSIDYDLKRLPGLLAGKSEIGRVDCRKLRETCKSLHVHKYPTFILLKTSGLQEIYYGRISVKDLTSFVSESALSPIESLNPMKFPNLNSGQWVIDFFAPWCPPCMRLLPEFRKASRLWLSSASSKQNDIRFGTVDCTVHSALCDQHNIHSYPTTIFFNYSTPYYFQDSHNSQSLLDFIEDTLHPAVVVLTPENFAKFVFSKRNSQEIWIVDFFAPWCGPCRQLMPHWKKVGRHFKDHAIVRIGQLDCAAYGYKCNELGITAYPTIKLYPQYSVDGYSSIEYNSWQRNAPSIIYWIQNQLPSAIPELNMNTFTDSVSKVVPGRPLIIDFYYLPGCQPCAVFAVEFENLEKKFNGQLQLAKINCRQSGWICKKFQIRAYPTILLFIDSTFSENEPRANSIELNSLTTDGLMNELSSYGFVPNESKKSNSRSENKVDESFNDDYNHDDTEGDDDDDAEFFYHDEF